MNALNAVLGSVGRFVRSDAGGSATEWALWLALLGGAAALARRLLE
jgi:MYXO-CTERM domain-containing protein